jgi:hypothetical protein
MRAYRLQQLADVSEGHILKEIIPGDYISYGGLGQQLSSSVLR